MNKMNRRVMSFLLVLAMFVSLIPSNVFTVFAADEVTGGDTTGTTEQETAKNEYEANVGKQAIIDVGSYYYGVYVGDEEYAKGNDDGAWDEFDYNPFSVESHRFVAIVEEYYHNERGEHWYKLAPRAGEEDQFPLSYPWVLHTTDEEIADCYDPTLAFYDADEAVYFKESYLALANDENSKTVLFVVAGPAALKDSVIDIQHIVVDEENPRTYPVSPMAFTEEIYNSTFSKAYSIYIGKPVDGSYDENGELITTPWTAADGTISVRYDVDQLGVNTYHGFVYDEDGNIIYDDDGYPQQKEIYIDYGAAFMYAEGELFSADITNMLDEFSDIVYTNSGNSTLVFEHMNPSFELINARGYFDTDTIAIYSNDMTTRKEYIRSELPKYVNVECFFVQTVEITDDQGEVIGTEQKEWYWISSENLPHKAYFLVPVDYITFMDPSVPQLTSLLMTKVRFLPEYQNEDAVVDFLYEIPGFEATALTDVYVYDLPAVFKIVDTYYTSEDDVYFKLKGDNGEMWPNEYDEYRWVSADLLELVTINYTNMAPFAPPVIGQSMAVFARNAVRLAEVEAIAERLESDGVETKKIVTPVAGKPGEYTVTLEAYVTGQKTTVTITEEIATDIILVLDQSGSMDTNDFKTITGYQLTSGRANNYVNSDVYTKIGDDEYAKVTVTSVSSYTKYTGTNYNVYNNRDDLYYKVNDQYWPIEVSVTNNWSTYTYYYDPEPGDRVRIGQSTNYNTTCPYEFYRIDTTGYTFSYKDANGVTQSETFAPTDNITANKYYTAATTSTITRLQALKDAVTAFAESVHEKAKGKDGQLGTDDDVKHRIAVVGFAHCYSDNYRYTNTELFVGAKQYGYNNYSQNGANNANSAQNHYDDAFQNMYTTAGYNNVIASKNALEAEGGTYVNLGIEMANGIFAANPVPAGEKRNRVVIVFTDGDPGYNGGWNGNNYGSSGDAEATADRAIANATTSKSTYGATVYTIGVFNGADAESPIDQVSKGNKFMHYVSNNFTGGTSFDSPGNSVKPANSSYYLSANNTTDLTGIFQQISNNVEGGGADTTLDETTVVRDIVSPNFVVPNGTSGIKYYTQSYIGEKTWADRIEAPGVSATQSTSGNSTTLDITGFDFSENYVGTEIKDGVVKGYRGKKLIIEFTINVDPDFLGGSNVDTNGAESGIYTGEGRFVEQFEQPKVNVALKEISTVVDNKYIYLGNTADLTEILNLYVKRNDQQADLKVTVDGINNAYVNLQYTITLDNNRVAVYTIPAGMKWEDGTWEYNKGELLQNYQALDDTNFAVTCVMTDAAAPNNQSPAEGSATVYVYKPTITFKDSEQTYKKPLNPASDFLNSHFVGAVWTHPTQTITPEGTAPTLSFEYSYEPTNAFDNGVMNATKDVPVKVTVTIDGTGTDIVGNDHVTFVHANCDHDGCDFDSKTEQFIVHVIGALTSLTIQKQGWNALDPNQTYLFRVTGRDADGRPINVVVTVHENGSVTIDGLVIGNKYTVTELTDWSWRYAFSRWSVSGATSDDNTSENGAEIKLGETGNVIIFENTREQLQWLDGDAWCDNRFYTVTTPSSDDEDEEA